VAGAVAGVRNILPASLIILTEKHKFVPNTPKILYPWKKKPGFALK
jgi:hypothetical protein